MIKRRRSPGREPANGHPHDCTEVGCKVLECKWHGCNSLSNSTVFEIHFVVSAVLTATVRWNWISSNAAEVAKKARQPTPRP